MAIATPPKPFARLGKHLSHSQVNLFDKCQLAWFFRYVRRIEKPPTVYMLMGQCYHKALALNFRQKRVTGEDLPLGDVLDCYLNSFEEGVSAGNIDCPYDQNLPGYRDQVVPVLEHYYQNHVVGKMEPLLVEYDFARDVPGIDRPFTGIIDLQLTDGTIVDFKTTSRKWSDADAASDNQSTGYAMLYGYDTDFEFHIGIRGKKTPAVQIVTLRRTRQDVEDYCRHLQNVVAQMKELEDGQAEPTLCTGFCNAKLCQYYQECQDWKYGGMR
jgi:hypothetical protein